MINKDKVIKGLYAHGYKDCKSCPYWGSGLHGSSECKELAREALSLLREQEPLAVSEGKINKCVCGNEINRYWHPEYCGFCGKKLEWY